MITFNRPEVSRLLKAGVSLGRPGKQDGNGEVTRDQSVHRSFPAFPKVYVHQIFETGPKNSELRCVR